MKRFVALFLLFGITGTTLYFFFKQPENSLRDSAVTPQPTALAAALPAPHPQTSTATTPLAAASLVPSSLSSDVPEYTNVAPAVVLENTRAAVYLYGEMFGGNPVGNNSEITSALNGNNPKHAKFLQPDSGMRINGNGELIDPWGTPFFFHQLSGSLTEIRSAGPDRKMWTSDDLVTR